MSMIGQLFIPKDPLNNIFSQLDIQALGSVQCVSKKFYETASNDVFWQNIFKHAFAVDVPHGTTGKEALRNCIIIKNKKGLINTLVAFLCRQKWEKKTRLECIFPTSSLSSSDLKNSFPECFPQTSVPTAIVDLGFGSHWETYSEFIESPVDESRFACFTGDVQKLLKGALMHAIDDSDDIPCYTSIYSEIPIPDSIHSSYFAANIEGVDVGDGNTLGYLSSINQWKEPFELRYTPGSNGKSQWAGRIPCSEFRFVKIDSSGNITEENVRQNRYWSSRSSYRPCSWEQYLKLSPISFA